jgi:hypothetical protein
MLFGSSASWASASHYPSIRKAAESGHKAAIKLLKDWIALPSIAAETAT